MISLTEELALQQARQADEEIKKGIYRGPLHGIPYDLKDLFAVKGYKFTIGTETYGSIVSPSHTCGATGLRPTFGSVSRSGAMVLRWSLDKIDPICRSAEDAAVVFYYIKGADGKDAGAINRAFNYTGKVDLKKLRIAYATNYFKGLPTNRPEWAVLETYRRLGAIIKAVDFPDAAIYPFNIMDVVIVPSFSRQLPITNLTGHPVVVFPTGFSANGLPDSITLIGNLYDEATILAVAKAFQDATDFNKKHPQKFVKF